MRTLLWSLIIVVAVLAVSSSVYTCGYQQDRLEYVLTDEMIVTNSNLRRRNMPPTMAMSM